MREKGASKKCPKKKNIPKQNNRHTHTHTHTHKDIVVVVTQIQEEEEEEQQNMLSFMHPYVAVIVDFINAVDAFMDRNGAEFNAYVLSIMMIVVGYAKSHSESEESERVEPKSSGKVGVIRGGELVAAVENANGNRVRDSLLRVGTTGVHENERGESGKS